MKQSLRRMTGAARLVMLVTGAMIALLGQPRLAQAQTYQRGDVFVASSNGQVHWRNPNGTLKKILNTGQSGEQTGMAFDAAGNLYVTNFQANIVSKFNNSGNLLGTFG